MDPNAVEVLSLHGESHNAEQITDLARIAVQDYQSQPGLQVNEGHFSVLGLVFISSDIWSVRTKRIYHARQGTGWGTCRAA